MNRDGQLNGWNDLAWNDVAPGANAGDFLQIKNDTATIQLVEPTGSVAEKHDQWADDKNVSWSKDASSADLAYVLFQAPVLIAVHAFDAQPAGPALTLIECCTMATSSSSAARN